MMRANAPVRLLVVEDDAEVAADLAELLEAHGAIVRTAGDPTEAMLAAFSEPTDIALIDLELGDSSGADLALQWHGQETAPAVILLSGRRLTPNEEARFAGIVPHLLEKPVDLARLIAEIDRLCRK